MNELTPVGTIEAVSLPEHNIYDVLAKIDTGADGSAIWASNVSEKDGVLSYNLFGPSSPHYNGRKIKTKNFSRVRVKNSFGEQEVRYKVSLKIRISGRTILARMTLANRNSHRFPILVGKRTLRGKFVVDVARKNRALGNKRILLVMGENDEFSDAYVDSLRSEGLEIGSVTYSDLVYSYGPKGNSIVIDLTTEDVASYSLVYFINSSVDGHLSVAAAFAAYLAKRNVVFIDRSVSLCPLPDKVLQYMNLGDNSLPIPPSIFMLPSKLRHAYEKLVVELGLPFVLKDINPLGDENLFLVNSKNDFDRATRQAAELEVWLIAQQYVPHERAYRLLTFGSQVFLAIKIEAADKQESLYRVDQSKNEESIEPDELPAKLIELAVTAAKVCGLQIAGVDLLQDKVTKVWYCLGVNKSPVIEGGEFIREREAAVAKYLTQRLFE